jgi:pilus assembly protein CpaE
MQRVAIVDPVDTTREPLRSLLLGVDFVFLEAECARYEFFYDVVQESPPDLVIVNLDADRAKALQLVAQLTCDYAELPVLVLSSDNHAILQALQAGAKHFLTQPVVLEDLLRALRKVQGDSGVSAQRRPGPGGGPASQVVAILGSRGGVGCTSVAVNLAASLAADPDNSVALVDLDLALGDCDVALDVLADHTLADLALNIDKLDLNYIRRSLLRHAPTGLSLLAHPMQMSDIGIIQGPHVERILNLLRISYGHLILDLSKGLTPVDLVALDMADVIFLVAQLELSSLRNVVRMLMTLGVQDGLSEKVRVVVNRVGSDHLDGDISLKKAEETIGRPIYWQIPNDAKAMLGSRIAGEPLIRFAPKSRAQQSIQGLALTLIDRQPGGSPEPAAGTREAGRAKGGGFLKGIFGKG